MVVVGGAVVAAWGDVDRRFLLHSARKSIMSALYGVHVDAGNIDLNRSLEKLGIDDTNPRLNSVEKQAKIIDLLRARSGVYHLAAAEAVQNPKPPRGSHRPGTHWCYNNWDFNALCTIIEQEVGIKVFEEFENRFAGPTRMQDYRARDGVYMYERDKSIHPAYHIRMSARDMARFGLLYLAKGRWNGKQILSEGWVRESTRSHSDDAWWGEGYGYMWWISFTSPFKDLRMYSALGVGEQSLDVIPGADMVFVHRTNTYEGNTVSREERLELLKMILRAKRSAPKEDAKLLPLPSIPRRWHTVQLTEEQKKTLSSKPTIAPSCKVVLDDGQLLLQSPSGQFGLIPLAGGKFIAEDTHVEVFFEMNADGTLARIIEEHALNDEGYDCLADGKTQEAIQVFKVVVEYYPESANAHDSLAEAYVADKDWELAACSYRKCLALDPSSTNAAGMLERIRLEQNPVDVPIATLRSYVGNYSAGQILLTDGKLHVQPAGDRPKELIALSQDEFRMKDAAFPRFKFVQDGGGKVVGIEMTVKGVLVGRTVRR
jgi:CubicO group peptidase (beta-lactamase class C family)